MYTVSIQNTRVIAFRLYLPRIDDVHKLWLEGRPTNEEPVHIRLAR